MTTEDIAPAQVFCLASYLYDEMVEREWTIESVAARMLTRRGPAQDALILAIVMSVQKDSLIIDDETFDGLGCAFGISSETFRNLHAVWLKWPDRRELFECPDDVFGPWLALALAPMAAQGIEARRAETAPAGSVGDESPVAEGDAPQSGGG